ncbi:hypothetical protein D3C79_509140 [compost metagenome]
MATAIRGGGEALVVPGGGEVPIQPAPDQGDRLAREPGPIRLGAGGGAGGVVPQGAADEAKPGSAGEHIVVEGVALAILAGALAAGAAIRADGGAAPAAEVFRQA